MNCEIISFTTKDNLELFGAHIKGKSDTGIIHIHGMTDHFFESNTMSVMQKIAAEMNYGFLSFNNRGAELISTMNHQFYGTGLEIFEECLFDIDAAIDFMKEHGYKKIILSGHSTGCQKSLYYQLKRKRPEIKAILFLSPADDMNFQKKLLGKKFQASVKKAHEMIKEGQALFSVPGAFGTAYFSARRYYNLYSGKSLEGHLFNYEENLEHLKKIKIPFFAAFGEDEQYAAMAPKKMLEKIEKVAQHKKSHIALIKGGDHSFHGQEKSLAHEVRKFLTSL